ncbi:MAG: hypothetical protein RMY29_000770 [Nostoc sp. CreGUA01]|nr:hypothetical protein [Nostoc sp. CreGUA01]
MERAYQLAPDILRSLIPKDKIGVYVLGNIGLSRFYPIYIGRSDICLLTRLLTHNYRDKATHVTWRLTSSIKQAFYQECCLYHTYEEQNFLNDVHPASPKGSRLICPVCSYTEVDIQSFKERTKEK